MKTSFTKYSAAQGPELDRRSLLAVAATSLAFPAFGARSPEPGVQASTIRVGQSIPLTGVIGKYGRDFVQGAELYFSHVNRRGGVHKRRIELITLDDSYDPRVTAQNCETLITKEEVFSLFGLMGTATLVEAYKVAAAHDVVIAGAVSGSDFLKDPEKFPNLFIPRAGHKREIEVLVNQAITLGQSRIGVVFQNDSYGRSCAETFQQIMTKKNISPVMSVEVDRQNVTAESISNVAKTAAPQVVVLFTTVKPAAQIVRFIRESGAYPRFMALSPVDGQALVDSLGVNSAIGIGITQVVPYPWTTTTPLTQEYRQVAGQDAKGAPSFFALEGFVAAKVLVDALRRTGPMPTRPRFLASLNSTKGLDLGGMEINFSPTDRRGSTFVELTVIGSQGRIVR